GAQVGQAALEEDAADAVAPQLPIGAHRAKLARAAGVAGGEADDLAVAEREVGRDGISLQRATRLVTPAPAPGLAHVPRERVGVCQGQAPNLEPLAGETPLVGRGVEDVPA